MLQDQVVNLTFSTGVDTKTNEKLAVKLHELENGVFEEKETIKKRCGYDELSNDILGGSTVSTSQALFTFQDELMRYANPNLYSYNEQNDRWISKGTAYSFNAQNYDVIRNAYQQSQADHALLNNIYISAWKDTRGTVRYTVKDFLTGVNIVTDQSIASSVDAPKFAQVGEYIFLFYCEASSLKCMQWNVQTGTAFSSALTVGADLHADHLYDVAVSGNNLVVAYKNTTPAIAVKYVKQDNTLGSTTNGLVNPIFLSNTITSSVCVNVNQDTKEIAIFWHNVTSGMQYRVLNFDFTDKLTTTVWDSSLTATASKRITCLELTSGSYTLYYEVDAAQTYNRYIKVQTANNAGTVGTAAVFKRSIGLASKAFTVQGNQYFLAVHDSTLQATYFLIKTNGDIVTKYNYGNAGGIIENNMLSGVVVIDSNAYICTQVKTKLISDNGTNYFNKGVQYTSIEFDADANFYRQELGKNLHISGGFLSIYDGQSVVEHGFHLFPENVTTSPLTSSGSMADGTYLHYVVYEWIDAKGQIHRSGPSIASSTTVSGGGGSGRITLTIPTLRLTQKVSPRTNVNIGVYRTKAGQTTAYRVSSLTSPTFNDVTVDTITYTDSLNDSSIGSNDLLYITGGVLPNGQTSSCKFVKSYKNRLFLLGTENGNLKYSKLNTPTVAVEFSDELEIKMDDDGGLVTGAESMDDYFVIFKKNRIYVLVGNGPNDLGQDNDYQQATKLPSDVGCIDPNSIVVQPQGMMFKSEKGIYLLTRQLQVVYIGADVEAYNSQTIMSADVIPENNGVVFLAQSGMTLFYDYTVNQWGTWTNHNGFDATIWRDVYCYLRSNNVVFKRNSTKFKDGEQKYSLKITTAWIKLNGIQNFQRIKRAIVLGDYYSQHIMRMSVAYDYNDYFLSSYIFNPDQVLETSIYGDSTDYGSDEVYGGVSDGVYQFDAHMQQQKCQAIRFKFEDIFNGTNGQAYSLTDLGLKVAVKKGLNKLRLSKKI